MCSVDGCEAKPYRSHGACRRHHAEANATRRCVDCGVGLVNARHRCANCYRALRAIDRELWAPAARATEYRLRLKAAEAKVRQAILVLEHPETAFPTTVNECLSVALEELEVSDVA